MGTGVGDFYLGGCYMRGLALLQTNSGIFRDVRSSVCNIYSCLL